MLTDYLADSGHPPTYEVNPMRFLYVAQEGCAWSERGQALRRPVPPTLSFGMGWN